MEKRTKAKTGAVYFEKGYSNEKRVLVLSAANGYVVYQVESTGDTRVNTYEAFDNMFASNFRSLRIEQLRREISNKKEAIEYRRKELKQLEKSLIELKRGGGQ